MLVTHLVNILFLYGVNAGDIPYNVVVPPIPLATSTGRASNSVEVEIEDDEEPYETARAVDSDDDRYVGTAPLTEEEMEIGVSQLQGAPST